MKILGIDPGSRNCGYAIVEKTTVKTLLIEAGLIKIKPNSLQYQITELCEGLDLNLTKWRSRTYFLRIIQKRF